ncbi:MAG: hypothetical protein QXP27_07840 [Candidatus Methanomethyliaceae archaeon]
MPAGIPKKLYSFDNKFFYQAWDCLTVAGLTSLDEKTAEKRLSSASLKRATSRFQERESYAKKPCNSFLGRLCDGL